MSQPALIGYQSQRGFGRKNLDPNGNFDIFLGCGRPARSLVTVLTELTLYCVFRNSMMLEKNARSNDIY
jgi:hypothetical protein